MSMETPPILGSREDVGYVSIIFHRWGKFSEVYKLDRNLIGEKGGTRGMVPLINPIYTLYSGYLWGILFYISFKGAPWGNKQLGAHHPKGPPPFARLVMI